MTHMRKVKEIKVENYVFEFWEVEGELVGPKINGKTFSYEDEEKLVNEAKKIYPSPHRRVHFTPFEVEFE